MDMTTIFNVENRLPALCAIYALDTRLK